MMTPIRAYKRPGVRMRGESPADRPLRCLGTASALLDFEPQHLRPLVHYCYFPFFLSNFPDFSWRAPLTPIANSSAPHKLLASSDFRSAPSSRWSRAAHWRAGRRQAAIAASARTRFDALLARSQQTGAAHPRNGGNKLRVVVVEDDSLLQTIYRETLSSWPMEIELCVFDHGLDALVEVGREPPDLLIADLRMPGLDGFEMIRRLRENPVASRVAIVVVSALTSAEISAEGGLPEDVTAYRKPVPFHELHGYMQALIAQRKRSRNTP